MTLTPDNHFVISTSRDGTVRLWNITTGEALGTPLTDHQDWVMSVAIQPDGTLFATTGRDGSVILWDFETRQSIGLPLQAHNGMVADSVFIADGAQLVTVGEDGNIIAWQTATAEWQHIACGIANRQLTPDEWERFLNTPYQETC